MRTEREGGGECATRYMPSTDTLVVVKPVPSSVYVRHAPDSGATHATCLTIAHEGSSSHSGGVSTVTPIW